jgi:hypothetical protein
MVHVELYGKFFLRDGLQNSDVSETIFAVFFRRLYHTYNCVLVVALEICGMWFNTSFTLQLLTRMEQV